MECHKVLEKKEAPKVGDRLCRGAEPTYFPKPGISYHNASVDMPPEEGIMNECSLTKQ